MRKAIILFVLLVLSPSLLAATSVWKVTKGGNTLYLVGTFHLLNASDHPLPTAFETAYKEADKLVFEIDVTEAEKPEYQVKVMQAMVAKDGRSLQNQLKPETYKKLGDFMASRQLPISMFNSYTAGAVTMVIAVQEYMRMGMTPEQGVESHFARKAAADKKPLGELETIEDQLAFIAELGKGQEDELVLYTLSEMDKIESLTREMKRIWREGDLTTMDSLILKDLRDKFPAAHKSIVVERNNDWLPQIEAMLKDKAVEAVMVGALHLAGKEGLIHMLKAKGYAITQM